MLIGKKKKKQVEYLVKWKGYPESDNLWQPASTMVSDDLVAAFEAGKRRRKVMK